LNYLLLLSGTPASGKDSVTDFLTSDYVNYSKFKKHKAGIGGKADDSYIHITEDDFNLKKETNDFIQSHTRYNRHYGISKQELEAIWGAGKIPVIHVGKYENINPFFKLENVSIFSVLLLTSRLETLRRLKHRHAENLSEIESRLKAYDEERQELSQLIMKGYPLSFNLMLDNSQLPVELTGKIIHDTLVTVSF